MNTPLKLKIALQDLPHRCERTLMVPEDITMRQLHFIIQDAMGWLNAHLFEFSDSRLKPSIRIGMPDYFDDHGTTEKLEAHKVTLMDSFLHENGAKDFWYNYDFGDDWWHKISFLKVSQNDLKKYRGIPFCIKAEGKCPPEDIGGPGGYSAFLDVIQNNKHPENYEQREWYGLEPDESYNELEISLEVINKYLREFYESDEWQSQEYDLF